MTESKEQACLDCGMALSADESWVCEDCCAFYEMTDPNGYGDDDGESTTPPLQES